MHLRLIAVGKLREPYLIAAAEDFRRRLRPYHRLDEVEVRAGDGSDAARSMADEADAILRLVAPSTTLWLLERTGTEPLEQKRSPRASSGCRSKAPRNSPSRSRERTAPRRHCSRARNFAGRSRN